MKFKKRKKFVHLLIPRILIAWALAGILSLGSVIGFFGYTYDVFVGTNQQSMYWTEYHLNKISTDDMLNKHYGMMVLYMDLMSRNFEGLGFPDGLASLNAKQYVYILDTKTGQVVCDSSMMLTLITLDYEEGDTKCYLCPLEDLQQIEEFRDMRECLNQMDNSWEEWTGKEETYNYSMEFTDYYVDEKNHLFYPGNTRINKYIAYGKIGYPKSTKYDSVIVDFSEALKDKTAGMKHIILDPEGFNGRTIEEITLAGEDVSDYRKGGGIEGTNDNVAEYIRNYYSPEELTASKGNMVSTVNPGPFHLGDRVYEQSVVLEGTDGLECHYIMVIPDLVQTYKPITVRIVVFWFILASLIGLLVTFIKYRKLLYFYRLDDYRKTMMNSMAHDLKTPLASLMGYAENLKENVQTEKRDHYASSIYENAEYMNGIIMDVLELSRMEDSHTKLHKESVNLIGLSEELKEQFAPLLKEKNLTLETEGKFNRRADKTMMKRAMENLLTNAIKYTKEGGKIRIYARHIPFNEKLIFENTPIDKIQTKTNKLWEAFVKGDDSRSEKNGTGLGLSIVNSILHLNNLKGKIICKGDSFKVEIK